MIALKPGVRLLGLSPQMVFAHTVVTSLWQDTGRREIIITSGTEGAHTDTPRPSGHYAGNALDYRTKGLGRESLELLQRELANALGPDFLVIVEDVGGENEHLHVEWRPRRIT